MNEELLKLLTKKKEAEWIRGMAQNQLVKEDAEFAGVRASVFNKTNALFGEAQKTRYTNVLIQVVDPWDPGDEDYDDIPF